MYIYTHIPTHYPTHPQLTHPHIYIYIYIYIYIPECIYFITLVCINDITVAYTTDKESRLRTSYTLLVLITK